MSVDRRGFLVGAGLCAAASVLARPRADRERATAPASPAAEPAWNAVRDQFALSRDFINLATFYLASHPRPVRDAIEKYRRILDENPLYVEEVLTTEHDHYSHHESIRLAVQKSGATMRRVALHDGAAGASEDVIVERLREAITPRTRAVGVTWVHSSTGLKLPIRRIADAVKAASAGRDEADRCLLIVDGVHGVGVEDEAVAATGCDFFAAGTHKWIFGPRGTGILWGRADAWPHTSVHRASMNGALESGVRVAAEVQKAEGA